MEYVKLWMKCYQNKCYLFRRGNSQYHILHVPKFKINICCKRCARCQCITILVKEKPGILGMLGYRYILHRVQKNSKSAASPCNLIFRLNSDPSPDMFNIFHWIVENAQWNNFISASVHLWPIVYSDIVETYSMHGKKFPYAVFLLKFVHAKQDNNWMKERIGSTWVFAAVQL